MILILDLTQSKTPGISDWNMTIQTIIESYCSGHRKDLNTKEKHNMALSSKHFQAGFHVWWMVLRHFTTLLHDISNKSLVHFSTICFGTDLNSEMFPPTILIWKQARLPCGDWPFQCCRSWYFWLPRADPLLYLFDQHSYHSRKSPCALLAWDWSYHLFHKLSNPELDSHTPPKTLSWCLPGMHMQFSSPGPKHKLILCPEVNCFIRIELNWMDNLISQFIGLVSKTSFLELVWNIA